MKILKIILIVLAVIIAIPLIAGLFIEKDFNIERQITINKPRNEVFEYVRYIKNQNRFSVWTNLDPNMKQEFRGIDGTVGFVSAWHSEDSGVGTGEQEIKSIREGERVEFELRFKKPFENTAMAYMTTEDTGNETLVKWGMNGHMNYPMNVMSVLMRSTLGKDLQTGLNNLKNIMEGNK
jgi:uncharacterized protein YndB with AHSA1/START domain